MEVIESSSFAENLYKDLKEKPFMTLTFRYDKLTGAVEVGFYNSTFPSIRSKKFISKDDVESMVSKDLAFSSKLLSGHYDL